MDEFEALLRTSMKREEPPEGFERRVLAAVSRRRSFSWRPMAAIAAAVMLVAGAGWEYERERSERAAGEAAKAKLELALKVTSATLHKVHQSIDSIEGY
jgi:hypothetical protein